jgi:rare lipoprotein A
LLRLIIFPPILLQGPNFQEWPDRVTARSSLRHSASGEPMDPAAMTAAHRTLPFGTEVAVINHDNTRSAVVWINDRSPFVRGRVINLGPATALAPGFDGLASVSLIVGGAENAPQKRKRAGWR